MSPAAAEISTKRGPQSLVPPNKTSSAPHFRMEGISAIARPLIGPAERVPGSCAGSAEDKTAPRPLAHGGGTLYRVRAWQAHAWQPVAGQSPSRRGETMCDWPFVPAPRGLNRIRGSSAGMAVLHTLPAAPAASGEKEGEKKIKKLKILES